MTEKQKIFVTGATGFLGQYLVSELVKKKEYDVIVLARRTSNTKQFNGLPITIVHGDIIKEQDVKSASENLNKDTVVIHLAAILGIATYAQYYDVHVEGAKNIIAMCHEKGIKRVIVISTTSTLFQKRGAYGETKNIADLLFEAAKFDLTILKPDFIYGKGGPGFTNNLKLIKGLPFIPMVGDGTYTKQPIHVSDVVKAILVVLENEKTIGKRYVLAGKPLFYNEIVTILEEALHLKKPILHIPQFLFYAAAFLLKNKKNAPFTKGSLDGLVQNSNFDITPLNKELGIAPIEFREGVVLSL